MPEATDPTVSFLPSKQRAEILREATETVWDLVVIGGGVTGAGIALDAATRGISTLLIEKADFAEGTSSRSTKLIHGGLRYLKQLELNLVREVGQERAIVHANAPHLVHPEELLLPIVENGSLGKYSTPVGLWLYEKLAGVPKSQRFQTLSKAEILQEEPLLNSEWVRGGARYHEYRTDDARLVIALLRTAHQHGAQCLNYLEAVNFLYEASDDEQDSAQAQGGSRQVAGIEVLDRIGGASIKLRASNVINAAGPWCDTVRKKDGPVSGKRLQLTKGVHLVFPKEKFPLKRAVYFDVAEDDRMVFAVPRGRTVYFGTTDTRYAVSSTEDIDHPSTTADDAAYLLRALNAMFPGLKLGIEDAESSWAGLRPLIHEEGKSPSELSRSDEVFQSDTGLISIAGGKLTGYRKMAERVVDMVMMRLASEGTHEHRECTTDEVRLLGGGFEHYVEVGQYAAQLAGEGKQIGLTAADALRLVHSYGREAGAVVETAYELHGTETDPGSRLLMAELHFGVEREMVHCLEDFLVRRTGLLYFFRPGLDMHAEALSHELAKLLGHQESERLASLETYQAASAEAVAFKS